VTIEEELLGEGGLPGVRVTDDREGPAAADLGLQLGHEGSLSKRTAPEVAEADRTSQ
jgi:hypothetical protein